MAELAKRYSRILLQKDQTDLVSAPFYVVENKVAVSAYSGGSGLPPGGRVTFQELVFIDGGMSNGTICTPGKMNPTQLYDYKPYAACGCEPTLSERMSYLEFDRPGWYRAVYSGPGRASVMVSAVETAQEAKSSNCSVPCCPIDVDLVIDKAVSSKVITAGAPGSFTLTITNKGPEASTGGSVADQLPTGLTYGIPSAVYSGGASGSQPALAEFANGDWHYTLLPVGGKIVITIPFTADGPGNYVPDNNQATVFPGPKERETNFGNNTDNVFFVVVKPTVDVWVTKSISAEELKEGDTFTYTVTVGNNGPDSAGGTIIKDDVPTGLVVNSISATYSGGASGPQPTEAQLAAGYAVPTLPSGGQVVVTIVGTAPKAGYYLNAASAKAPGSVNDSDPANNTATVPLTVVAKTCGLYITKAADAEVYDVGDQVTYTVNFGNLGPDDANGAIVKDIIPTTLSGVVVSTTYLDGAGSGTPTQAQLAAGWAVPTLPAGGSAVLTITGVTTVPGVITNQASITTPPGRVDTNIGNNNAIVVISVAQQPKTDVCGAEIDDATDKYLTKGNIKTCVNGALVDLDCNMIVKTIDSCCESNVIIGTPTGLFDAAWCVNGDVANIDQLGRLVWQSRDDTMLAGSSISSGAPVFVQFDVTNNFDCPSLLEISMQAICIAYKNTPDNLQTVTFIHKIGDTLNVAPANYGSTQWMADNGGWSWTDMSYNSNSNEAFGGTEPYPFARGSSSAQTTAPAMHKEILAAGQTKTFFAQYWIVMNDVVLNDFYSFHAGFDKNSFWKLTRAGEIT